MTDKPGVWMTCPMSTYLQDKLSQHFTLIKSWETTKSNTDFFLTHHSTSIKAIVGNGSHGADATLIDSFPCLEIIASHSSGLDQIDLDKCREKGIRVTSTPDALTHEVADTAVALVLATLRRICVADRFVRNGVWKNGDFGLTTRVCFLTFRNKLCLAKLVVS
ncbi:D-3-phosphoglycerate dehydrogenase [Artemisia annua]|uniref:D-3-phosphoglycerate dehydrogenase n=1 Tax=Artemisia annua TaxID=35608 RepID=A0A2U1K9B5_ARTAN|nr:D-3-phosphoglycerate dehydrogenase [Artemisia annua]